MTATTIEHVTFRLTDGTDRGAFARAAEDACAWIEARPGFVARRLSEAEDGTWVEHIEWESLAHARDAAAAIGAAPEMRPFVSAIDGPSVTMRHATLVVARG